MTNYTLSQIEAGAQEVVFSNNTTTSCNPESVILLQSSHYHWLVARVKELEAQAARDAELLTEALRIIDESAINDAAPHIQTIHVSLSDRARG